MLNIFLVYIVIEFLFEIQVVARMNQVCMISMLQSNFAQTTAQKVLFCIDLAIFYLK